jgi:hypothetical protein
VLSMGWALAALGPAEHWLGMIWDGHGLRMGLARRMPSWARARVSMCLAGHVQS